MELGRLDEETTANVGAIEGGTAANVVAGRCRLRGARRGASTRARAGRRSARWSTRAPGRPASTSATSTSRCSRCSAATGCPRDSTAVAVAAAALRRCGTSPSEVATGGGSDANALHRRGLRLRAARQRHRGQPHPEESVAAARIGRCSTSARRSSRRRPTLMLKLRRGRSSGSADPLPVEVEGRERPAWADPELVGRGRDRRRGGRQHRGARPRARLRRLRRRPRQPDPRPRGRGRGATRT